MCSFLLALISSRPCPNGFLHSLIYSVCLLITVLPRFSPSLTPIPSLFAKADGTDDIFPELALRASSPPPPPPPPSIVFDVGVAMGVVGAGAVAGRDFEERGDAIDDGGKVVGEVPTDGREGWTGGGAVPASKAVTAAEATAVEAASTQAASTTALDAEASLAGEESAAAWEEISKFFFCILWEIRVHVLWMSSVDATGDGFSASPGL